MDQTAWKACYNQIRHVLVEQSCCSVVGASSRRQRRCQRGAQSLNDRQLLATAAIRQVKQSAWWLLGMVVAIGCANDTSLVRQCKIKRAKGPFLSTKTVYTGDTGTRRPEGASGDEVHER